MVCLPLHVKHSSVFLFCLATAVLDPKSGPMSNLDFDIDHYLNRFIPSPRLYVLPTPISWFLGYRSKPRSQTGSLVVWFWAFIGAFCGIAIVENIYRLPHFKERGAPLVIASLGAAAILEYNTIDSPLSQPRNAILGQLFASIVGVGITKLFELSADFENLRWLAGALSVGVASAVMGLTNTIHPPAGATALLAATSPEITELGWYLIPLVLLGSVLLVAVACVINNIQRTFPVYWWTWHSLSRSEEDIEKSSESPSESEQPSEIQYTPEGVIKIDQHHIIIPSWLPLEFEERAILEVMQTRLQHVLQNSRTAGSDRTLIR